MNVLVIRLKGIVLFFRIYSMDAIENIPNLGSAGRKYFKIASR